jgi:hypothetical protein
VTFEEGLRDRTNHGKEGLRKERQRLGRERISVFSSTTRSQGAEG